MAKTVRVEHNRKLAPTSDDGCERRSIDAFCDFFSCGVEAKLRTTVRFPPREEPRRSHSYNVLKRERERKKERDRESRRKMGWKNGKFILWKDAQVR